MKVRKSVIALFLLPASLVYLGFILFPAIWAFYFSVFDWSGFTVGMKYVGFGNFIQLSKDPLFWLSIKNTLFILVPGGLIIFLLNFYFNGVDQFWRAWEKIFPGDDLLA